MTLLKNNLLDICNFIFATTIFVITWFFIINFLNTLTEMLFVPWDTVQVQLRPEIGTWERSLNDFFEAGIGAVLFSAVFVMVSLINLAVRFKKEKQKDQLLYLFSFLNFSFFVFIILIAYIDKYVVGFFLSDEVLNEVGYKRNIFSIFAFLALLLTLFFAQAKIPTGKLFKKVNIFIKN